MEQPEVSSLQRIFEISMWYRASRHFNMVAVIYSYSPLPRAKQQMHQLELSGCLFWLEKMTETHGCGAEILLCSVSWWLHRFRVRRCQAQLSVRIIHWMLWNPIEFSWDGEINERERKAQKGLTKIVFQVICITLTFWDYYTPSKELNNHVSLY